MNKDDVKKIDEITAEETAAAAQEATDELTSEDLEKVNGGRIIFKSKKWWGKMKIQNKNEKDGAVPNEHGASGGW